MRHQFLYNTKESRFCGVDCYYIYDTKTEEYITDIYNNVTCIHIDRLAKRIYFYGMHTDYHWILEKNYFKMINEFLSLAEAFDIIGYTIDEDCIGGKIYYKYKK